ncbi:glycosyltransferase family 2 protein [Desulforhabdus sp. TSK]|uniref:glycosyltransferase n=1 Tax=Desulforhabdus sp. TSK TaxID=2925014 RepID=UPI001FC8953A|nr:glycosyltransferase [Desulforhabdus sp. TSK]GKT10887.1 hypothetical protein DSTSK_41920 [Desulforhabdus sp. TSK]
MNFSIIIPAKNEAANIRRCLESISSVAWPPNDFEVLVIDNGSSDHTVEIAKSLGATVFIRPNDTIAGLRNFGAAQSQGKVLVFLDADCTVFPSWLQEAARYLHRQDVVCLGSPPIIPSHSTWVQRAWFLVRQKKGTEETSWLESMNMFVQRESFLHLGGFNTDLVTCEDYDLSLRLKTLGKVISDDRIVAVHHGEAASVSHFFRKEFWRAQSNFKSLRSHAFQWKELPSVIVPLGYCLFAIVLIFYLLIFIQFGMDLHPGAFAGLLVAWQLPIGMLAFWKARSSRGSLVTSHLYLLLNVYFFARGLAVLQRKR